MLSQLRTALDATKIPVAHIAWSHAPNGDYIVYAEEGSTQIFADNAMRSRGLVGTVDLYTRDDSGGQMALVEAAIISTKWPWYLNSIQYEADTHYIHYEWVFEAVV